jgi:hypothetical protein
MESHLSTKAVCFPDIPCVGILMKLFVLTIMEACQPEP